MKKSILKKEYKNAEFLIKEIESLRDSCVSRLNIISKYGETEQEASIRRIKAQAFIDSYEYFLLRLRMLF